MNMLTQLQTPIPLETPKGKAWAVAIIDYGPHWDLLWVTFVHDSGECWTFNNREIRQEKNFTFGLNTQSPIHNVPPVSDDIGKPDGHASYRSTSAPITDKKPRLPNGH